jgi:hypothetical protein
VPNLVDSAAGVAGVEVEVNSGGTDDWPGTGVDVERNRSGTVLPSYRRPGCKSRHSSHLRGEAVSMCSIIGNQFRWRTVGGQ